MKRIIFLNGPPGCGKDTVGRILAEDHGAQLFKAAAPLRAALCGLLGVDDDMLEALKGKTLAPGVTGRDMLIALSEELVKPRLGRGWFGIRLGEHIAQGGADLSVVTDAGFTVEVEAAIRETADCAPEIWRIWRPQCNFDGDSRDWVRMTRIPYQRLFNTGTLDDLREQVSAMMPQDNGGVRLTVTVCSYIDDDGETQYYNDFDI